MIFTIHTATTQFSFFDISHLDRYRALIHNVRYASWDNISTPYGDYWDGIVLETPLQSSWSCRPRQSRRIEVRGPKWASSKGLDDESKPHNSNWYPFGFHGIIGYISSDRLLNPYSRCLHWYIYYTLSYLSFQSIISLLLPYYWYVGRQWWRSRSGKRSRS